MQRPDLRTAAAERVIVLDGATGTGLQLLGLSLSDFDGLEGCNEILNISRPDAVASLHESYLEAGADAVLTNTFGASTITLGDYDLSERTREINRTSATIARGVADRFSTSERPRYVLGSIGPGTKLPTLGHVGFDEIHAAYLEQARGLLDGGVDALLVETVYDLLQGKAAILACKDALAEFNSSTPLFATVTIETTGQMLVGSEIGAALTALAPLGLDGIGLNCATGPDLMHEPLRHLSANAETTLLCSPNAGLPRTENGQMVYDLTPSALAEAHRTFVSEYGVGIVGGCCGTTPEHVRAMREAMNGLKPVERHPQPEAGAASLFVSTPYRQDASFLIVGERANANGSRRFKRLLQNEEWEQMANVIRDQAAEGAHIADICVDFVGRDGTPDMAELVSRARGLSTLPLMLDSTEPQVLEAGLKQLGGKALVNSINLEDGGKRLDQTLSTAIRFGAGVVALVIDEVGQARTCERKLEIARRLYRIATEDYGLAPEDLFFDALTLPVSTGQDDLRKDGLETLNAVEAISREFPRAQTILGISNISFGLNPAARQVLNSVFLHDAVEHGLKAAIVHAAQILPINRIPEEQLKAARRLILDEWAKGPEGLVDPLQAFMALFEDQQATTQERDRLEDLPLDERLHRRIVDGQREGLEDDLDEALQKREAIPIINDLLLPAMQEVGDLFGAGDMQLPFVLQSAQTMKKAVAHLEPHMDKLESTSKGSIVLATVRGDVHDIGKNLVEIILSNNGFTTINLGIKQPISNIIEAAIEHNADAIGLSGLLVKSTLVMKRRPGRAKPSRAVRPLAGPAGRCGIDAQVRRVGPAQHVPRRRVLRVGRVRGSQDHERDERWRRVGRIARRTGAGAVGEDGVNGDRRALDLGAGVGHSQRALPWLASRSRAAVDGYLPLPQPDGAAAWSMGIQEARRRDRSTGGTCPVRDSAAGPARRHPRTGGGVWILPGSIRRQNSDRLRQPTDQAPRLFEFNVPSTARQAGTLPGRLLPLRQIGRDGRDRLPCGHNGPESR